MRQGMQPGPIKRWLKARKITHARLARELGYKHRETVSWNLTQTEVSDEFFGRLVQRYPEAAVLARHQQNAERKAS